MRRSGLRLRAKLAQVIGSDAVANAGPAGELLALGDWRRRVAELYSQVRATPDPLGAWRLWRAGRDELFARHPQIAAARARARLVPRPRVLRARSVRARARDDRRGRAGAARDRDEPGQRVQLHAVRNGRLRACRSSLALELYWLEGYGGGLYVPFADATSGAGSFGGGRYLLDTVKGADLGTDDGRLVLDFNFAYNPSCAYDPQWLCPLAPPANRLPIEVRAGERFA